MLGLTWLDLVLLDDIAIALACAIPDEHLFGGDVERTFSTALVRHYRRVFGDANTRKPMYEVPRERLASLGEPKERGAGPMVSHELSDLFFGHSTIKG